MALSFSRARTTRVALALALLLPVPLVAEVQWTPVIRMGELFPSYIIATATAKPKTNTIHNFFGDLRGQIGVKATSRANNAKVRVAVSSTKLIRESSLTVQLPRANTAYHIFPKLEYDYDALYAALEPFPETVTVRVSEYNAAGKAQVTEKKVVVDVRSLYDCLHGFVDAVNNRHESTSWMTAAFVDENASILDEILQQALKSGIVSSINNGYKKGQAGVVLQVYAIWDALQRHGIKYSSISATSDASKRVSLQHIRLVGDALTYQQANCVEGSVLFASLFKKTGIITDLVLVPRHCFICVYLDKERQIPFFIETTMLGLTVKQSKQFDEGSPLAAVNKAKAGHEDTFNTFVTAQASAYKKYHSYDNDPERDTKRKLINISECRKMGITPLKAPVPAGAKHAS